MRTKECQGVPLRADDSSLSDDAPDQSAVQEDNKLVQWALGFKPRDPSMPCTRLDVRSLGEFAVCCRLLPHGPSTRLD
jgi:hypothetical protein